MIETSVGTLTASSPDSETEEDIVRDGTISMTAIECRHFVDMTQSNGDAIRGKLCEKTGNDYRQTYAKKSSKFGMMEHLHANNKDEDSELGASSSRLRQSTNGMVRRKYENSIGPYGLSFSPNGAVFAQRETIAKQQLANTRRKSIDSSFDSRRQSAKVYNVGKKESRNRDPLLPPLVNSLQVPSLQVENVVIPSGYVRRRALSGQDSDDVKTQSTESRTGIKPSFQKNDKQNRRSASADYTNSNTLNPLRKFQRVDTRASLSSGVHSLRNESVGKQSNSNSSSLKNAPTSRPITANRNSFNNIQTARQQYTVVLSGRSKQSSEWASDFHGPPTERAIVSRGATRGFVHEKRTHSVYSPSSVGSTEKLSARLKFFRSQRRASLPNTGITGYSSTADVNRSPEFFKAVSELTQDAISQQEARNSSEAQSSTDKSATSAGLGKDPSNRRDLLQRIEEVTPENSFNLSSKFDSTLIGEKSLLLNRVKQKVKDCVTDKTETVEKDENINDELPANAESQDKKAIVSKNPEIHLTQPNNKVEVEQSNQFEVGGNTSTTATKQTPSRSFFHVPEVGKSKKVTSQLQHCQEISKNEENRHFLFGAPDDNEDRTKKYFDSCGCSSDKDDIVDISTVYENDDDLCDEDFHRKRIIMWLMDVQTGKDAEQAVRNKTPPPSPEPGTQETAIVVVYKENGKTR